MLTDTVPSKSPLRRSIVLASLMVICALVTPLLAPNRIAPERYERVDLAKTIPFQFAGWIVEPSMSSQVIDPRQKADLDRIYEQVLARTYRHVDDGQLVMLSIAIGDQLTKRDQVHRPEVCYPAQGFEILQSHRDLIDADALAIPVTRIIARMGPRNEPITYWMRVGREVVNDGIGQKMASIRAGLAGERADAMVFRVSSVEVDSAKAYAIHNRFVTDLLQSMPGDETRRLLLGARVREAGI